MTRTAPPKDPEALLLGTLCRWADRYQPQLLISDLRKAAAMCAAKLAEASGARPADPPMRSESTKVPGPSAADKSPQALMPVLLGLADGLTNGQMALATGLTEAMVERRVRWLRAHYEVDSRRDVVEAARKAGDLPEAASTPVAAPEGPSAALKPPSGSTEPQAPSSAPQAAVQAVRS